MRLPLARRCAVVVSCSALLAHRCSAGLVIEIVECFGQLLLSAACSGAEALRCAGNAGFRY